MSKIDFFKDFSKPSQEEWKKVLIKELKGLSFDDVLVKKLTIEELEFESALSIESLTSISELNCNPQSNDWVNEAYILVVDAEETNTKALQALMSGATGIRFVFPSSLPNLNILFRGIELEYISLAIECTSQEDYLAINSFLQDKNCNGYFLNDPILSGSYLEKMALRGNTVRADVAQQAGANAVQEIAYALKSGHELLVRKLNDNLSIVEINNEIQFNFGIGSNYLIELSKFRAFQALWQSILTKYDASFIGVANVSAQTTFVNKSLKDTHTNLLRQTTEVMSACLAGTQAICVVPYDAYSQNGASGFTERMSLNISNILKEESYLNVVNEVANGSYAIAIITELMVSKCWVNFQEINVLASDEFIKSFSMEVKKVAKLRVNQLKDKTNSLIGVNVFLDPNSSEVKWKIPEQQVFPFLILEEQFNLQTV